MELFDEILGFLNPLNANSSVYKSVLELVITKIKNPSLSIRAAESMGMLNLSSSYHYDCVNKLGTMFINESISLKDFPFDINTNMNIVDGTFIKREGKLVYGAKKIKNYVNGIYELLQDLLLTVERYNGLNFITDFKIINHNKRHKTKPEEVVEMIKCGKVKKGIGLSSTGD